MDRRAGSKDYTYRVSQRRPPLRGFGVTGNIEPAIYFLVSQQADSDIFLGDLERQVRKKAGKVVFAGLFLDPYGDDGHRGTPTTYEIVMKAYPLHTRYCPVGLDALTRLSYPKKNCPYYSCMIADGGYDCHCEDLCQSAGFAKGRSPFPTCCHN